MFKRANSFRRFFCEPIGRQRLLMEAKDAADNPIVLAVIAHDFARTTQDISKVQSLILAHEHFVESEVLLEAFILEYAVSFFVCTLIYFRYSALKENDQINQLRIISFLKKWIDLDRSKFMNADGLGKRLQTFIASPRLPENLKKTLYSALAVFYVLLSLLIHSLICRTRRRRPAWAMTTRRTTRWRSRKSSTRKRGRIAPRCCSIMIRWRLPASSR
jgi:hypothetical protein